MNYSNLEILKELKKINNIKDIEGEFNLKPGLVSFLMKKEFVIYEKCSNGREVPFLTSYGKDFIKKGFIYYFIKDYEWLINTILVIIITIVGGILANIFTKNI